MQVQIKENGYSPVYIGNGQYSLFSGVERTIKPQESCIIDTKVMIHLPINYGGIIVSGELSQKYNIQTSYDCWNNKPNQTVTVMLTNLGTSKHVIYPGDQVAKMLVVHTNELIVRNVEKFEDELYENSRKTENGKEIASKKITISFMYWFKQNYIRNSKVIEPFINDDIKHKLEDFKKTLLYTESYAKCNVEANFIWEQFDEETKANIQKAFLQDKENSLKQDNKKEKPMPKPPKPKKKSESESDDSESEIEPTGKEEKSETDDSESKSNKKEEESESESDD